MACCRPGEPALSFPCPGPFPVVRPGLGAVDGSPPFAPSAPSSFLVVGVAEPLRRLPPPSSTANWIDGHTGESQRMLVVPGTYARRPRQRRHGQRDDADRDDTGRDDTGRDDTGSNDTGRDDTGRDDTGRDDTGRDDTGRGDTDRGPPPKRPIAAGTTPTRRRGCAKAGVARGTRTPRWRSSGAKLGSSGYSKESCSIGTYGPAQRRCN